MSLINKMLNELELKKKRDANHSKVLFGVMPIMRKQRGSAKTRIILLVIILAFVFGVFWYSKEQLIVSLKKAAESVKSKIVSKQSTLEVKTEEIGSPEIKIMPASEPVSVKQSISLQSIIVERKNDKSIVNFILSSPATYYIEQSPDNQKLFITLDDVVLEGNLPVNLDKTFLMALDTVQNKNNTKIIITLLPGTEVGDVRFVQLPRPHLHLSFSNSQLTKSAMSKKLSPLTPEQLEIEKLKEIQRFLAHDKTHGAIHHLHLFLGDFPNNLQARTMLVSLLIKSGRVREADEILKIGLNKNNNYIPFVKLKARILIEQHDSVAATNLLEKHASVSHDMELMAMLASLYQQQQHFMAAAHMYNQMTKIQPLDSRWWVGLGMALEGARKVNAALEAYRRASEISNTPPELREFIRNKLNK